MPHKKSDIGTEKVAWYKTDSQDNIDIIDYLEVTFVSFSILMASVGEERTRFSVMVTSNFDVSDRRSFPFLWMLVQGCVILLWHTLGLPYIYSLTGYRSDEGKFRIKNGYNSCHTCR